MGSEPLDKLVFALDGDISGLEKVYSQADAGASRTGRNIRDDIGKGFTDAAKTAQAATRDMGAALDGVSAKAAKTGAVWETTMQSINRSTGISRAETKAAAESWDTFGRALGDVKDPADKLRGFFQETPEHVRLSRRELFELGRVLTGGEIERAPFTLAKVAVSLMEIDGATLAVGAGFAAIPILALTAAVKTEQAFARMETSIRKTGNAVGVTLDEMRQMAREDLEGLSRRGNIDALSIMAGRGNISGGMLSSAIRSVPGFAAATGASQDEATAKLEQLFSDPSKGAEELNSEFKLLDEATTRQIQHLTEQGRLQDAQKLLIEATNQRFEGLEKSSFSLANAFDNVGKFLSNVWFRTGAMVTGADVTNQDRLTALRGRLERSQNPSAAGYAPLGTEGERRIKDEITRLEKVVETETAAAREKGAKAEQNRRAKDAAALADTYDKEGSAIERLGNQHYLLRQGLEAQEEQLRKMRMDATKPLLPGMRDALNARIAEQEKMVASTRFALEGVGTASANQKTPAQLAAEQAADAVRVAMASPRNQGALRERLGVQRSFEANLSNPEMAPYAEDIRRAQMSTVGVADAARRRQNLKDLEDHTAGIKAEADAYKEGAAAAEAARIAAQAKEAFDKGATDSAKAYAKALSDAAFQQERLATAQRQHAMGQDIAGLQRQVAAGGSPAALASAARITQATKDTEHMFASAGNDAEKLREAEAAFAKEISDLTKRDQLNARAAVNAQVFGVTQQIQAMQFRGMMMGQGLTPDDQRHVDTAIQTFDDLVHKGLDPTTEEFKETFNVLYPLNARLGDMADAVQKAAQAAKEYADDITGGIKGWIMSGGKGGIMGLGEGIGQSMLATSLDKALEPLNDQLTKVFGEILGVPTETKADGSIFNPYYVRMAGAGGGMPGAGGGGLGSIFDGIFGGGGGIGESFGGGDFIGTASDPMAGGGGLISSVLNIASMFGGFLADGGAMDPSKFYVVGEKGPEIWGPGHAGNITPLAQTRDWSVGGGSSARQSTGGTTNVNMTFNGITDMPGIVRSRSQIEGMVTNATARGQRNR